MLSIRVPRELQDAAKVKAQERGETVTNVVVRAMRRYVRDLDPPAVMAEHHDSGDHAVSPLQGIFGFCLECGVAWPCLYANGEKVSPDSR